MATKHDFHKVIIGRSEMLEFIDLGDIKVPAKTDTGAFRSSVHASKIAVNKDGTLSFDLLNGHKSFVKKTDRITVKNYSQVTIINSFGHREERYEVSLKVKLGPKVFTDSFSLSNRANNSYPVLLGRKLLNDRFLVDSAKSSLNRNRMKKVHGIDFPIDEEDGR
jgi:hypothetical protein